MLIGGPAAVEHRVYLADNKLTALAVVLVLSTSASFLFILYLCYSSTPRADKETMVAGRLTERRRA